MVLNCQRLHTLIICFHIVARRSAVTMADHDRNKSKVCRNGTYILYGWYLVYANNNASPLLIICTVICIVSLFSVHCFTSIHLSHWHSLISLSLHFTSFIFCIILYHNPFSLVSVPVDFKFYLTVPVSYTHLTLPTNREV